jgi:hypothetical protein
MIQHIQVIPLLCGLIIGIIVIFCVHPEKKIVYTYPTPDTAKKIIYKDKNDVCYQYDVSAVDCDQNESRLKPFPLDR